MSTSSYQRVMPGTPARGDAPQTHITLPLRAGAAQRLAQVYQLILDRVAEAEARQTQAAMREGPAPTQPLAAARMGSPDSTRERAQPAVSSS